jgi:hypothetical protein
MLAHRFSYELAHGVVLEPWPIDVVLHSCDFPSCCNPACLIRGTTSMNVLDAVAKGLHAAKNGNVNYATSRVRAGQLTTHHSGEANHAAVLSKEQVEEIRGLYAAGGVRQIDLARRFGIGQSQVGRIVRRESWCDG